MKQKTVPWDEATLDDLKKFASGVLGMQLGPNIGEEKLRGKIRQAFPGDTITFMELDGEDEVRVGDAPVVPSEDTADGRALRGPSAADDLVVKLTIAEVEGAGGKRHVYTNVNGVSFLIPRGRPVDVPYRYYSDLIHAVKTVHEQDEATGEIISSDIPAYPMSVNVMPPQDEIDAWLAADARGEHG